MTPVGIRRPGILIGTVAGFAIVALAIACTNDQVTGPGFVCDVTNPVSDIVFDAMSNTVLVHSPSRATDTVVVVAHALNRVGNVRTDVPISFESSDTAVATVDKNGVLHAQKPGSVRVTASSCGTKASANFIVALLATAVEIKFDTTSIVAGDSVVVRARAHPQGSGATIPSSKFAFTFTAPSGTTLTQRSDSTAVIKTPTTSGGTVVVSATGEGVSGSGPLVVVPRVVDVKFDSTAVVAGDSIIVRGRTHGQGSTKTITGVVYTFAANPATGITFVQRSDSTAIIKTAGTLGGAVVITATGDAVPGSAPLTIVPRVVEAKLDTVTVVAGDSVLVSAKAHPQDSPTPISGAVFTFTSSPSAGVTVSQRSNSTAMIKTSVLGTFVITTTNLGVSGATSLTVLPRVFIGSFGGNETGVDAGRDFNCGLIPLGRLYCWGVNGLSQLGAATDSLCFEEGGGSPLANPCSLIPVRLAPQLAFTSVSAGDGFACGLIGTPKIYCWGDGFGGKLGNGKNAGSSSPTPITFGVPFASVSSGGNHACALSTGGSAYCWGQDSAGQLGDARFVNSTTPIPVLANGTVAAFSSISSGFRHTCGLDLGGLATCWGLNDNGQLGTGSVTGPSSQPLSVAGGIAFKAISTGGDTVQVLVPVPSVHYESHTCAIAQNGAAYCWGSNASGQLGNGSVGGPDISVPTTVTGGLSFAKISAGARFTCGLTTGGAIYCWGRNSDLQLGRGSAGPELIGSPQQVSGGELPVGTTFVSVSAGKRHACGVGSDGAAYCWGSNVFGALGNTLQAAFRGFPQKVSTPQ